MTCLIVDNEPAVRRLMAEVLAPLSAEVIECADGGEAIDAYARRRPDVVLMDIAMSPVDGLSATRTICAADPSACVVIVSNLDGADLRAAATTAGARAYVRKENLLELMPLVRHLTA